jgi:hypothetical protein
LALATAVVSRLFSILRLNPPASIAGLKPEDLDLLVATGPGVPGFELLGWFLGALVFVQFILRAASVAASTDSREVSLNALALMFIRVYVRSFNISEWALAHGSVVWLLVIIIVVAGGLSYLRLGRNEDPNFTIKTMVVQVEQRGGRQRTASHHSVSPCGGLGVSLRVGL